MKIKLDENLPERLVAELNARGHNVDTVRAEHLVGQADDEVWQAAQSVNRFLITQDLDFSDARRYVPGTHAGLLLVRLARPGRDALIARIAMLLRRRQSISGAVAWLSRPTTRFGSSAPTEDDCGAVMVNPKGSS